MRALVSGSTGFSGSFLVAALRARGAEVCAVSQRAHTPDVLQLDLTSSADWASVIRSFRPDHVFHLSGVAHSAQLSDYVRHNTAAAAALLDAVTAEGGLSGALLLVGTAAEYGLVPEANLPVDENFPATPRTPYGVTKFAQTQLGLAALRGGLRVIVARPSNIVGPGMPQHTALGSFARQLREIELGQRPPVLSVGDLGTSRDFVDVRDVVEAYVALAMERDFSGLVNVASGELTTLRWLLERLIAEFGVQVSIELDPARVRAAEVQKFSASARKLREVLGARNTIPLADSVRDLILHERAVTTAQTL